jgi:hypothetical protein
MFRPISRPSSGAIWQYYNGQVTEYLLRGSTESRYYVIVVVYYIANMQYEYTIRYIIHDYYRVRQANFLFYMGIFI